MLVSLEDFISRFSNDNFFIDTNQIITFYNYYKYGMYKVCGVILRDRLSELSTFPLQKKLLLLNDDDFIVNINFDHFEYNGNYHLKDIFRNVNDFNNQSQLLEYNHDFILFYKYFVMKCTNRANAYDFKTNVNQELNSLARTVWKSSVRTDMSFLTRLILKSNFYTNFLSDSDLSLYLPSLAKELINYLRIYNIFKNDATLNYYNFDINTKTEYSNLLNKITNNSFQNSLFNFYTTKLVMEL